VGACVVRMGDSVEAEQSRSWRESSRWTETSLSRARETIVSGFSYLSSTSKRLTEQFARQVTIITMIVML